MSEDDLKSIKETFTNASLLEMEERYDECILLLDKLVNKLFLLGKNNPEMKLLECVALTRLGDVLHKIGKSSSQREFTIEALRKFIEALLLSRDINERTLEGQILRKMGASYDILGEYEAALENYQHALEIQEDLDEQFEIAAICSNIGSTYHRLRKYQEALDIYQKALSKSKKLTDKSLEGTILNNIATVYQENGQFEKSLRNYLKALNIAIALDDKKGEGICLNNIGYMYLQLNQIDMAFNNYWRALNIARECENKISEEKTLNNIGAAYHNKGEYQDALKHLQDALAIAKTRQDKESVARSLNNIGLVLKDLKKYNEALDCYNKVLDMVREFKILGIREDTVLNNIATVHLELEQYQEALDLYQKSLKMLEETGDIFNQGKTLSNIGVAYRELSDYRAAIEYLKKSFKLFEQLIKTAPNPEIRITARKDQIDSLAFLISSLILIQKFEEALAYIELNKGREISSESGETKIFHPLMDDFSKKIYTIQEEISKLEREIAKSYDNLILYKNINQEEFRNLAVEKAQKIKRLEEAAAKLKQEMWVKFPSKANSLPEEPIDLITSFRQDMISKWIILDFYYDRVDSQFIVFCFEKKKEIKIFKHSIDKDAQNKIITYAIGIIQLAREKKYRYEVEKNLLQIGELLFKYLIPVKLQKYLEKNEFEFLTIIPTELMYAFPLELIHDGNNYWGLKYAITRAFNLYTLRTALSVRNKKQDPQALIIGDPTANILIPHCMIYGGNDERTIKVDLSQASEDAKKFETLLRNNGYKTKLLLEKEASENNLITELNSKPYTLIHFAGHAFFNASFPDLSFLLVHEGNQPSLLYGNKISSKTRLKGNPLIILVACETGGVETKIGDEVFGLARGFLEAGASGMILAGWAVRDFYSSYFFHYFYNNYLEKKYSLAESMRLARLHVIDILQGKYEDEGYFTPESEIELIHWAPYRVYGLPF